MGEQRPEPGATHRTGESDFRAQIQTATEILETIIADRKLLLDLSPEVRGRFLKATGEVYCPEVSARKGLLKARKRQHAAEQQRRDEAVLNQTGIRTLRSKAVFMTPNVVPPALTDGMESAGEEEEFPFREVGEPQNCYICKQDYSRVHPFYDQLCPPCAELNYFKRTETADLRGRVALLTGGRVKIGYQAGIKLLRAGARLIVTTRFPRDSAARYAREPDFATWADRLEIFGLDLRHTPSVEAFCRHLLATRERLDFIVNNACQTVRRPPDFYRHMMEGERVGLKELPPPAQRLLGSFEGLRAAHLLPEGGSGLVAPSSATTAGFLHAAELSQVGLLPEDLSAPAHLFPEGQLDQDLQQIDLRERNSWRLQLAEISSVELLETQLVNAVAPFLLNARLKPLMLRTPERDKHVVNVSAVEGQFYRKGKTTRHPHTNMAKAALNMMTRTSAAEFQGDGIHMNSVDTGWVNDEDPAAIAARKKIEHRFHPPLDIVDGAARIVDPIISGFKTGVHVWGKFLKDYKPTDW